MTKDTSVEMLHALFFRLDVDRSNSISKDEIIQGMKMLNKSEVEIQELVKGIEEDQDFDLPGFMGLMGVSRDEIERDTGALGEEFQEKISQFWVGVTVNPENLG